jgi:glycosyltransferase involved in cell wall biosynthesis
MAQPHQRQIQTRRAEPPSRSLRIALLSWESLHSIAVGGVGVHVSELADAIAASGHEVHIFTRRGERQASYERVGAVHYHRCDYRREADFVDDVNAMCAAFAACVFATEDMLGAFDVVHAHDWLAANAMIWVKQTRGRRSILTVHSTEYGRCGNELSPGQSSRVRFQEQAGMYWADHVITVSRATLREVHALYRVPLWKTSVIHNAVRPTTLAPRASRGTAKVGCGIGRQEAAVLFCGRLEVQKGPDILLEAIPEVLGSRHDTRFLFAGEGSMRGQLETRAGQLGLGRAVRFLGRCTGSELPTLYRACDAVCVPSRNEPFGIVVLEAWSAARPVVVTRNGGPAEYVDEGRDGLTVDPEPPDVAAAIARLLEDGASAAAMGRRGKRKVRARFTWNVIADQTLDVYDPERFTANAQAEQR